MAQAEGAAKIDIVTAIADDGWPRAPYAWYVLFLLILVYAVATLDRVVVGLLVDAMKRDLGLSDTSISLLIGLAFSLFYTIASLPVGILIDRYRRVPILTASLVLFSVATGAFGVASSFAALFIARMFIGAGEAAVTPTMSSLIADYFRPELRAKAYSFYMLGGSIGTSLAYLVGASTLYLSTWLQAHAGLLGSFRDWQLVFIFSGLAGLILALLFGLTVREPVRRETAPSTSGAPRLGQILRDLSANLFEKKLAYLAIIGGAVMNVFLIAAQLSWYPTLFVRVFGLQPAEVGGLLAVVGVPSGIVSALASGFIMAWLVKRGRLDAPLIMMLVQAIIWGTLGVAKSLAPSVTTSVALHLITSLSANFGLPAAFFGLTQITHNRLRGQMTALYTIIYGLISITLGPLAVGLLSDYVFTSPTGVAYSLASVFAIGSLTGISLLLIGWKDFVAASIRVKGHTAAAEGQ